MRGPWLTHPERFIHTAAVAASIVLIVLMGCAQPSPRPILIESPTPLVAAATLVSPIDRAGAAWAQPTSGEPPPLLLSDGQRIPASITTFARSEPASPGSSWLPDAGPWRRAGMATEGATTMLVAPLPQGALGQSVWMAGRRLPAFWVLPTLGESPRSTITRAAQPATVVHARARALVEPELANPMLRWRAELALAVLGVEPPAPAWDDPILHDWAEQSRARWRAAEQRLRQTDPALADRLIGTLTRWLRTPDAALPIWPTRAEDLNDLILAIVRPGASDEAITRTVLAYLDRQPRWLAWVADDAGGLVGGSIAAVNLSSIPALLSIRGGGPWEAHGMVPPGELALVPAPSASTTSPTTSPTTSTAPTVWEVRMGGRTRALPVTTTAVPLAPPGMPIGPFWHDWTLAGLTDGTGQSANPGQTGWVGGLIQKDPRLDAPASGSSGWVVYVEVRRPPCKLPLSGQPAVPIDAVRVCFGPTGTPRAEVIVRCSGLTTFEAGTPGEGAMLTTTTDRWAFTLPIDRAWLEPDGTFLIGAQFLPHDGRRATWPRPLLPHQQAIGRVRIDPAMWDLRAAVDRRREAITAR